MESTCVSASFFKKVQGLRPGSTPTSTSPGDCFFKLKNFKNLHPASIFALNFCYFSVFRSLVEYYQKILADKIFISSSTSHMFDETKMFMKLY